MKNWLAFWIAIFLLVTSKVINAPEGQMVETAFRSSLMTAPLVWVFGIFIHRADRLGSNAYWRVAEFLTLILMTTVLILGPFLKQIYELPISVISALTMAYCGVVLLSIGGRVAVASYLKVNGRRFFWPVVPEKINGLSDYIPIACLSLAIFFWLVLKHNS